ncbi:MAG TPA: hypothetical protein VE860_08050 [Chthoniobacterales bacterium]|nr:hypothetical protein [Chthoniobacterales bacterium]
MIYAKVNRFLIDGTKPKCYGVLKWVAHCEYQEPSQLSITQEPDRKWFVGFGFKTGKLLPKCQAPQTKEQALIAAWSIRRVKAPAVFTILLQRKRLTA